MKKARSTQYLKLVTISPSYKKGRKDQKENYRTVFYKIYFQTDVYFL